MAPFNVTNLAPGVYVEEIELPGPIAGVGTSTAAIVGPAKDGPIGQPTLVTTPTQFTQTFGDHITAPRRYASHAVDGFFLNGGTMLYFVRVGTAARASRNLPDPAGETAVVVTAKQEGTGGNSIEVEVEAAHRANVNVSRAESALAGDGAAADHATAEVADASGFRPDDVVILDDGAGTTEVATVASTDTASNVLTLKAPLTNAFAAGTVRLNDFGGRDGFRVDDSTGIEPGSYLRITQVDSTGNTIEDPAVVKSVLSNFATDTHRITLEGGLNNTYRMAAADNPVTVETQEFTLRVTRPGEGTEVQAELAMDPRHSRYFASAATFTHVDVTLADPPSPTAPIGNIPDDLAASSLENGANDDLAAIGSAQYKEGIDALRRVEDVNIICVPDDTGLDVQGHLLTHCADLNRFAVLDPKANAHPTKSDGIKAQRDQLSAEKGHGALYYPRIMIADRANGRLTIPPSGHIAGLYARTDQAKGVHKAPANEQLRGVLGLEQKLNETEQGFLNDQSINVLRNVPGRGFRVWGARTVAPSTQWRYVNVRRLVTFVERSLIAGTQGVVFEPNNLALWEQIKRIVNAFLTGVWRDGALFGATPQDAFRVRVDEELNPPTSRALGLLLIEVVLFPTTPAEFIVFRIIQEPGGPVTLEE